MLDSHSSERSPVTMSGFVHQRKSGTSDSHSVSGLKHPRIEIIDLISTAFSLFYGLLNISARSFSISSLMSSSSGISGYSISISLPRAPRFRHGPEITIALLDLYAWRIETRREPKSHATGYVFRADMVISEGGYDDSGINYRHVKEYPALNRKGCLSPPDTSG